MVFRVRQVFGANDFTLPKPWKQTCHSMIRVNTDLAASMVWVRMRAVSFRKGSMTYILRSASAIPLPSRDEMDLLCRLAAVSEPSASSNTRLLS